MRFCMHAQLIPFVLDGPHCLEQCLEALGERVTSCLRTSR